MLTGLPPRVHARGSWSHSPMIEGTGHKLRGRGLGVGGASQVLPLQKGGGVFNCQFNPPPPYHNNYGKGGGGGKIKA